MPFVETRFISPTTLTTSAASALYTVPTGYSAIIKQLVVTNITGTAATFTFYIGAASAGNALFSGTSVAANDTVIINLSQVLTTGEILRALASAGSALNLTVSGVLNDGPLASTATYIADNAITSAKIADGAIVNADINASAAIDQSKINAPTAAAGTNTTQLATTAFANAAGGLQLITACTVTSAGGTAATASGGVVTIGTSNTSVTVSSAFSTTYDNYKIVGAGISTTVNGGVLYLKINNSTGSTYFGNMIYNVPATSAIGGVSAANGASNGFFVATTSSSGTISFEATIDSPFLAVTSNCFGNYAGRAYNGQTSAHDSNAASSTGFILAPSSGTMTGGTIRVYGYRNS